MKRSHNVFSAFLTIGLALSAAQATWVHGASVDVAKLEDLATQHQVRIQPLINVASDPRLGVPFSSYGISLDYLGNTLRGLFGSSDKMQDVANEIYKLTSLSNDLSSASAKDFVLVCMKDVKGGAHLTGPGHWDTRCFKLDKIKDRLSKLDPKTLKYHIRAGLADLGRRSNGVVPQGAKFSVHFSNVNDVEILQKLAGRGIEDRIRSQAAAASALESVGERYARSSGLKGRARGVGPGVLAVAAIAAGVALQRECNDPSAACMSAVDQGKASAGQTSVSEGASPAGSAQQAH